MSLRIVKASYLWDMKKTTSIIVLLFLCFNLSAQNTSDGGYGENLITVHPFFGYTSPQLGDVGIGLSYERFLNEYISAKNSGQCWFSDEFISIWNWREVVSFWT